MILHCRLDRLTRFDVLKRRSLFYSNVDILHVWANGQLCLIISNLNCAAPYRVYYVSNAFFPSGAHPPGVLAAALARVAKSNAHRGRELLASVPAANGRSAGRFHGVLLRPLAAGFSGVHEDSCHVGKGCWWARQASEG